MEQSKVLLFEVCRDPVADGQNWQKWKRSLEYYLSAKDITANKQKFATLLHLGGSQLQEIYDSLPQSEEYKKAFGENQYDAAVSALVSYFEPKITRVFERYRFCQITQGADNFQQFITKLRTQAQRCTFASDGEAILDQIVIGTSSNEL